MHLECCDGLGAVLHQVAKLINLPALVIKPKGCRPKGGLRAGARLPIGHKAWLQGVGGHGGAQCWLCCLRGSCRSCFWGRCLKPAISCEHTPADTKVLLCR